MTVRLQDLAAIGGWRGPITIQYECGVWGKFSDTADDFGWIGRSRDFNRGSSRVEDCLGLGSQDDLSQPAALWRVLNGRCFAVAMIPSRVQDRHGRRGFERMFLEWNPAGTPVAVGALVLLPHAMQLALKSTLAADSQLAAGMAGGEVMLDREDIQIEDADVNDAGQAAVTALLEVARPEALIDFYAALLAREGPAILIADRSLPPAAVAALLLPLEPDRANQISLAGWIVSYARYEHMAPEWQGIAYQRTPAEFQRPIDQAHRAEARSLLEGLQLMGGARSPSLRPVARPAVASPFIESIAELIESTDRWPALPSLPSGALGPADRQRLASAVSALGQQVTAAPKLPPHLHRARLQELQQKLDHIREHLRPLDGAIGDDWRLTDR